MQNNPWRSVWRSRDSSNGASAQRGLPNVKRAPFKSVPRPGRENGWGSQGRRSVTAEIESLILAKTCWRVASLAPWLPLIRQSHLSNSIRAHLQPTKEPWLELWVQKIWVSKCVANSGIQILLRDVLSNFEPNSTWDHSHTGWKNIEKILKFKQWYFADESLTTLRCFSLLTCQTL